MILHENELKRAAELVAGCEEDLKYRLSRGQTADLLCDNCCDWTIEKCSEIASALHHGHGVGAFHMAEARIRCGS